MVKFTILLKRKPSLTHDQFVEHHRNIHADLFMSVAVVKATVRRYVQQHALPVELPGMPPVKYDGVTELWFDDVEALERCFSDSEYLQRIRPDEESFLDLHGCDFIVSRENVVKA
ncbi:EthD domain-containing protein [Sphingomonas bacterium]|nr:EthD domain-containing protein [Sphingomonas bacterium]